MKLLSTYPDYEAIYKDGLFIQGSTDCFFVCEDQLFSY
jgi:hypothetical protein